MGCWGLLGLLLIVSQWIIPENSLLSISKSKTTTESTDDVAFILCSETMRCSVPLEKANFLGSGKICGEGGRIEGSL
jgi:hypothetical protein